MAKSAAPQTQATLLLKANKVVFEEYLYDYEPHGGAEYSAQVLGLDPFSVVKTLIMEDENKQPLVVLMHGNKKVSTKALARQAGLKTVQPCLPACHPYSTDDAHGAPHVQHVHRQRPS